MHICCAESVVLSPAYLLSNELKGHSCSMVLCICHAAWHMLFGSRTKFICSLVSLWVTGTQHMAACQYCCQPIPANSPSFSP